MAAMTASPASPRTHRASAAWTDCDGVHTREMVTCAACGVVLEEHRTDGVGRSYHTVVDWHACLGQCQGDLDATL